MEYGRCFFVCFLLIVHFPLFFRPFQKDHTVYFQTAYLDGLRDMLAPFYGFKSQADIYSDEFIANQARFFHTMNNFLTWCAVRDYIKFASKPFRKAYQDFTRRLQGRVVHISRYSRYVLRHSEHICSYIPFLLAL